MKPIGESFGDELRAAGLTGLPFSWGSDGVIQFAASMTQAQIAAVKAVYAAHDPNALAAVPATLAQAIVDDPEQLSQLKAALGVN